MKKHSILSLVFSLITTIAFAAAPYTEKVTEWRLDIKRNTGKHSIRRVIEKVSYRWHQEYKWYVYYDGELYQYGTESEFIDASMKLYWITVELKEK